MIVDTHAQLWTKEAIEGFPAEMAEGYRRIFGDLGKITLKTTLEDMDAAGVERSVIVAQDAETKHKYKVPNELVAQAVRQHPDRFIGFASVDPHKGKLAIEELERAVQDLGLRGLKLLPHLVDAYPNDPVLMYPLYEKAQDLGIPVLFHMGTQFHTGTRIKYCQPLFVDDVAVDFPRLRVVIAHFGFPWVGETIAVVQRNPNVYFNIAGWAPRYLPEMLLKYMDGPLASKALYGSDFPLISRVRGVKEFRELPLSDETKRKVLIENPRRFLNLNP